MVVVVMVMMMMMTTMTTMVMMRAHGKTVTVDGSIADAVTHLHACRLARVNDLIQLVEATAAE